MLNLKENLLVDTFVFRKFAWQSPDFLCYYFPQRFDEEKLNKALYQFFFIMFHEVFHEQIYTSHFSKWLRLFFVPHFKRQLWWNEQSCKTTWVALDLPTDVYFGHKVIFPLHGLIKSKLSFRCSWFFCLQACIFM